MDVSTVAALSSDLTQARQSEAIAAAVLRKTMQIQGKLAVSLLDAVSQVPAVPLQPDHIGKNIDTTA
ncbi:MAG TPA: YjfB family protein [Herminiimonas sp.]|jgi:hypothetical protein|nr:YjfB family protein [Herminiimonas sp.]